MKLLAHFLFLIRSNRVLVLKGTRQLATARVYYSGAKIYQGGVKGRGNGVGVEVGGRRGGGGDYKYGPSNRRLFLSNEP